MYPIVLLDVFYNTRAIAQDSQASEQRSRRVDQGSQHGIFQIGKFENQPNRPTV
jgi:hypothetical protein